MPTKVARSLAVLIAVSLTIPACQPQPQPSSVQTTACAQTAAAVSGDASVPFYRFPRRDGDDALTLAVLANQSKSASARRRFYERALTSFAASPISLNGRDTGTLLHLGNMFRINGDMPRALQAWALFQADAGGVPPVAAGDTSIIIADVRAGNVTDALARLNSAASNANLLAGANIAAAQKAVTLARQDRYQDASEKYVAIGGCGPLALVASGILNSKTQIAEARRDLIAAALVLEHGLPDDPTDNALSSLAIKLYVQSLGRVKGANNER